jgi:WD40 repeat protein
MSLPGIVLCSAGDGSVTRMVEAHTAPVNALVFTSSAALLVSASEDRTIVVTDTASGRLVELLTAHTTGVRCLALSSDGSRLLSIPSEGAAKLWSTTDWKEMARIDVGEPIDTACCAPDGGWVLLGGSFGLRLWKSGELSEPVPGLVGITAVSSSPDGKLVVVGAADGQIRIFSANGWIASKDAAAASGGCHRTGVFRRRQPSGCGGEGRSRPDLLSRSRDCGGSAIAGATPHGGKNAIVSEFVGG